MWQHDRREQKEQKEHEGALGSHKTSKKHPSKAATTEQTSDAAESERQDPAITAATTQLTDVSETRPSTGSSERTLTSDSPVIMVSPYRTDNNKRSLPRVTFSKGLLIRMEHNKQHLEIDLFRPESEGSVFPLHDLSPLCLYRELRTLKITGMMQSYQSYIWLVVWLNPQLTDLALEMAGKAEPLDVKAIAKAQQHAKCKPTMREVAQGKTTTVVLQKFHIINLSLTNFVVYDAPFQWFSDMKLQKVELHRCEDAGFELPSVMERSFNITVTV